MSAELTAEECPRRQESGPEQGLGLRGLRRRGVLDDDDFSLLFLGV